MKLKTTMMEKLCRVSERLTAAWAERRGLGEPREDHVVSLLHVVLLKFKFRKPEYKNVLYVLEKWIRQILSSVSQ
jgi:hypothetical protein